MTILRVKAKSSDAVSTAVAALRVSHYELVFFQARLDEARTIADRSSATVGIARAKLAIAEKEHLLAVAKESAR